VSTKAGESIFWIGPGKRFCLKAKFSLSMQSFADQSVRYRHLEWTSQTSAPVNVHFAHLSIQHRKRMCPGGSGQRSIIRETTVKEVSRKADETFTQQIEGRILSVGLVHQCERIIGLTSVQSDLHGLRIIATACLYRASGPAGNRWLRDSPQTPQRPIRCITNKDEQLPSPSLVGKKGVILFEVSGWSDPQGHATLFNGQSCYDHCYFNEPEAKYRTDRANFWGLR